MPEGDVVWRTAQRLDAALAGRALVVADLRWPSLATVDLTGRTVIEVVARGKHLLTRLDGFAGFAGDGGDGGDGGEPLTLHSHLRMEGSWRINRVGPDPAGHTKHPGGKPTANPMEVPPSTSDVRAVLANQEWQALGLRLGLLDLLPTSQEGSLVGHLGPDVLGPDWDAGLALANVAREPACAIGSALLDQRNLAGVGTFYMTETLFLIGCTPWSLVGDLGDGTVTRIIDRAARLLQLNRDRVRQTTTGVARPGQEAFVHGRSGRPCRRCGTTVRVAEIGAPPTNRVAFYCPTCQAGPAPTDDQRPQRPLGVARRRGR